MDTETSQAKIKKQNEEGGRSKSDQPTEKLKEGFLGRNFFLKKKVTEIWFENSDADTEHENKRTSCFQVDSFSFFAYTGILL